MPSGPSPFKAPTFPGTTVDTVNELPAYEPRQPEGGWVMVWVEEGEACQIVVRVLEEGRGEQVEEDTIVTVGGEGGEG